MRQESIVNKCVFHRHSKTCTCAADLGVTFKKTHKTNREHIIEEARKWMFVNGLNCRTPGWKHLVRAYIHGYEKGEQTHATHRHNQGN